MTSDYEPNAPFSQVVLRGGVLRIVEPVVSIKVVQPPIRYIGVADISTNISRKHSQK